MVDDWRVLFMLVSSSASNLHLPLTPILISCHLLYQSFKLSEKNPFIWHTSSVTLIYLTKNYMFLCLLESNNAWKKAVRIFATPFSIYFAIRHEPIQSNLLMKICQQPKVRERNWWFAIIHTPCIRFNRFCFGSFCVFFFYRRTVFLAAELLTSSKWVSHDITRTNQIKRTEKSSASFVGLFMRERIDRITRTWYSHAWRLNFQVDFAGNRMMDTFGNELWTWHTLPSH